MHVHLSSLFCSRVIHKFPHLASGATCSSWYQYKIMISGDICRLIDQMIEKGTVKYRHSLSVCQHKMSCKLRPPLTIDVWCTNVCKNVFILDLWSTFTSWTGSIKSLQGSVSCSSQWSPGVGHFLGNNISGTICKLFSLKKNISLEAMMGLDKRVKVVGIDTSRGYEIGFCTAPW